MEARKLKVATSNGVVKTPERKSEKVAINGVHAPTAPPKRRQKAANQAQRRNTAPLRPHVAAPVPELKIDRDMLRGKGFIDPDGGRSKLAEEFRLIKRPLLARAFAPDAELRDRVILVTSSRPGEGKTFSAVNLALSLSRERDANVLLIDADQAVSGTSTALEQQRDPGLVDLLSGSAVDPAKILRKTDIDRLWFIPPGIPDLNLTEYVASDRMSAILDTILKTDPRRIIVIDAPPLLATSESMALTMHAGQTVFVVEAGGTPRDTVEEALSMIAERTEIQMLLNKAQSRRSRAAYYGSYYGDYEKSLENGQSFWRRVARMIKGRPMSIGLLTTMGLAAAPIAFASISIVPRIDTAIGYTDNINYSNDNNGDFGAEIAPGVEFEARSSRVLAKADYTLRQVLFLNESSENELSHNLIGQVRGEIVNDALFLDLEAEIDQDPVDARGTSVRPIFGTSEDFAQRFTRSISPFFRREVGDIGDAEVRYRFTRSSYNDNEVADANSHSVGAVLDGAPTGGPFSWSAQVLYDDTQFEDTSDEGSFSVETGLAALESRYDLNDRWGLLGGIGYSLLNDDTLDDKGDGSIYWKAGFVFEPNTAYKAQATVGQAFAEPTVDIESTARISDGLQLEANYNDGLQSRFRLLQDRLRSRDFLTNERRTERQEALADLETLIPGGDVRQTDDNTFRQRRGELALNGQQGRNLFRVEAYAEDRDFDQGNEDRFLYGAGAAWTRQLTRQTELGLRAGYTHTKFDDDNVEEDEFSLGANYIYAINDTTEVDLGYDFYQRLSDDEDEDVLGNTVFVRLRKRF